MVTLNIPIAERTSAAQRPRRRFAQPVSFWRLHAITRNYG
jgi:hypothetical protein